MPPPAAAQPRALNVAIVVHPQAPVDTLTFGELRKVFRGERQYWTSDVPIVLLMRAPVAVEREVILKRIYEMSEAQFRQFWIAKIFRDEAAVVPKILYSKIRFPTSSPRSPAASASSTRRRCDPD